MTYTKRGLKAKPALSVTYLGREGRRRIDAAVIADIKFVVDATRKFLFRALKSNNASSSLLCIVPAGKHEGLHSREIVGRQKCCSHGQKADLRKITHLLLRTYLFPFFLPSLCIYMFCGVGGDRQEACTDACRGRTLIHNVKPKKT